MERLLLIDTDAGVDDATAIFLCLAAHKNPERKLKIVGITCVSGNTSVDNVCINVTRILNTAKVDDVNNVCLAFSSRYSLQLKIVILSNNENHFIANFRCQYLEVLNVLWLFLSIV